MGQSGAVARQLFLAPGQYRRGSAVDGRGELVNKRQLHLTPFYQPLGGGRRGLDTHVGHIVEHGDVALVAYADDHRDGKLGNVRRQFIIFKRSEVGCRAATADDDHAVPLAVLLGHSVERGNDRLCRLSALHQRREQPGTEPQTARGVEELMDEVAETGRSGGRHHRNPLHQRGPLELAVEGQDTLGFEPGEYLHALTHEVAHGIGRVDGRDVGRQPVGGMKRSRHIHHHLHAAGQTCARGRLKLGVDASHGRAPDGGTQLGDDFARRGVLLHQFEIAVGPAPEI